LANLQSDDFLIADQSTSALGKGRIQGSQLKFDPIGGPFKGAASGQVNWILPPSSFTPLRVASCRADPRNAYCLGYLTLAGLERLFVIRTENGVTWSECQYVVQNRAAPLSFTQSVRGLESLIKSRYSIAVHPSNAEVVAVGYGAALLSNDAGKHWFSIDSGGAVINMSGWHADLHELHFSGNTLLVPSDGGVVGLSCTINEILEYPDPYPTNTSYNRDLPVLMFMDPGPRKRSFAGNLTAGGGMIAAGSMDNSNLWFGPDVPKWRTLGDGD